MKRNVKRTVAIMVTGLFGASLAATTDFAAAQNRMNAGPVAQMRGGKAFLKPATTLQGMRSQLQRNEAAKMQPLTPGLDKTRASAAAQNRQAVNPQLNKLQSTQQQLNGNAFNSNEKRLQQAQSRADKTRSMVGKLQSSQQQINRNIIGNMR
jgi:hypothetical protein